MRHLGDPDRRAAVGGLHEQRESPGAIEPAAAARPSSCRCQVAPVEARARDRREARALRTAPWRPALSIPTAEPSTPGPTYGTPARSRSPWIAPVLAAPAVHDARRARRAGAAAGLSHPSRLQQAPARASTTQASVAAAGSTRHALPPQTAAAESLGREPRARRRSRRWGRSRSGRGRAPRATPRAETTETSCSTDAPPNSRPTRSRSLTAWRALRRAARDASIGTSHDRRTAPPRSQTMVPSRSTSDVRRERRHPERRLRPRRRRRTGAGPAAARSPAKLRSALAASGASATATSTSGSPAGSTRSSRSAGAASRPGRAAPGREEHDVHSARRPPGRPRPFARRGIASSGSGRAAAGSSAASSATAASRTAATRDARQRAPARVAPPLYEHQRPPGRRTRPITSIAMPNPFLITFIQAPGSGQAREESREDPEEHQEEAEPQREDEEQRCRPRPRCASCRRRRGAIPEPAPCKARRRSRRRRPSRARRDSRRGGRPRSAARSRSAGIVNTSSMREPEARDDEADGAEDPGVARELAEDLPQSAATTPSAAYTSGQAEDVGRATARPRASGSRPRRPRCT